MLECWSAALGRGRVRREVAERGILISFSVFGSGYMVDGGGVFRDLSDS